MENNHKKNLRVMGFPEQTLKEGNEVSLSTLWIFQGLNKMVGVGLIMIN